MPKSKKPQAGLYGAAAPKAKAAKGKPAKGKKKKG